MPGDPLKTFARNLRMARKEQGLTQERLADLSEMNLVHYGRIERAETEPGIRTVVRIANALGVPVSALVEGDYVEPQPRRCRD